MAFLVRYLVLILVCIVLPIGYAFYEDTQSMLLRSAAAGAASAEAAPAALTAQMTLRAHEVVGLSMSVAQELSNERQLPLRRRGLPRALELIDTQAQDANLVWIMDEDGNVLARKGVTEWDEEPERITGLPLFRATQRGYALDGYWSHDGKLYLVGAAPLVVNGLAMGAVFSAFEVGEAFVKALALRTGTELSVLVEGQTIASTLPDATTESILSAVGESTEPVLGGRLQTPLAPTEMLKFLPLFVPRDGDGIAYASVAKPAPASEDIKWVMSAPATEGLLGLAERQEAILGLLVAAVLFSMLIGYSLQRSYVRPLGVLVEHLSELNMRDGDRELSEYRVARPFRRLVKLVNMTVQKIPTSARTQMSLGARATGEHPAISLDGGVEPAALMDDLDGLGATTSPSVPVPGGASAPKSVGDLLGAEDLGGAPAPDANLNFSDVSSELGHAFHEAAEAAQTESVQAYSPPTSPPASPKRASEIRGAPSHALAGGDSFGMAGHTASSGGPPPPPPATSVGPAPSAPPDAGLSHADQDDVMAYLQELQSQTGGSAAAPSSQARMGGSAAIPSSEGFGSAGIPEGEDAGGFRSEATVVSVPDDDLLAKAAAGGLTGHFNLGTQEGGPDRTVVADVPQDLIDRSAEKTGQMDMLDEYGLDAAENAHFQETYERFVEMRRACGEPTADLAFDKFVAKLRKNREGLVQKYGCRTVRFQVYRKEGRAALKATPIRS